MPVSAACMARGTAYFWMMSLLAPMWSTWPWVLRTTTGLSSRSAMAATIFSWSAPGSMTAQARVSSQ